MGEKFRVIGTKLILALPSSLFFSMPIPLDFYHLDGAIPQFPFSFTENTDWVLGVGKIGLEFQIFYTGGFGWYAKTFLQLHAAAMLTLCAEAVNAVKAFDAAITDRGLRYIKDEAQMREMQRAWIESRKRSCDFYWDFFQGTMASPMSAFCENRETARRALFLLGFLDDAEGR